MRSSVTIGRVRLISCVLLLATSFGFACSGSTAYGQNGYGLGFFNYGGDGYGINFRQPPYYALFPPVYYSYPVARPYGYSPFAYPPGVMTPEAKPTVGAAEYLNPFVPSKPKPATNRTASLGQTYINPFVQQAGTASGETLTGRVE